MLVDEIDAHGQALAPDDAGIMRQLADDNLYAPRQRDILGQTEPHAGHREIQQSAGEERAAVAWIKAHGIAPFHLDARRVAPVRAGGRLEPAVPGFWA